MSGTVAVVLLLHLFVLGTKSDNILVTMPLSSKSHKHIFNPIVKELAHRGHTVTIISPYKEEQKIDGITEVVEPDFARIDVFLQNLYIPKEDGSRTSPLSLLFSINSVIRDICTRFLSASSIRNIAGGSEKFDLVILDLVMAECGLGLAYKLRAPFIYFSPNSALTTHNHNLRTPLPNSFCPSVLMALTDKMTFFERLLTAVSDAINTLLRHHSQISVVDEVTRAHLGEDVPPCLEIERNVSLVILNSNPAVNNPKPLMPHIIEAGGVHCRPAKALPQDLEEWIAGAGEHGFVYMSFGSVFKDSDIPNKYKNIFLETFSKIPQRVYWKIKGGGDMKLPPNVRLSDWAPQQDLLGHPSIRVFISHGGLLSVQESTYHGVPILGIPSAIDQMHNIAKVKKDETGVLLNWDDITVESFTEALNILLTDQRFKDNIIKRSKAMKDIPQTPLETSVFWIEHVLRHKGTPHLRSAALDLNYYQFYQLDVLAFLLSFIIIWTLISYWIIKTVLRFCCKSKRQEAAPASTKTKKKAKRS